MFFMWSKGYFLLLALIFIVQPLSAILDKEKEVIPNYLYKILSVGDWQLSQGQKSLKLSNADEEFIHFSTEDQLSKIIEKYWKDESKFVILKIDTAKLPGKLVFEANPGGTNKYYHLYNGSIPRDAIIESKIMEK